MSSIGKHDIKITIGDTESLSISIAEPDPNNAGATIPVDITGRTYAAQIRQRASSSSTLAAFTATVTDGANGKLSLTIPATTTAELSPTSAAWDFQETNGSVVTTLLGGAVEIIQDVTR